MEIDILLYDINDVSETVKGYSEIELIYQASSYPVLLNGVQLRMNQKTALQKDYNVLTIPRIGSKSRSMNIRAILYQDFYFEVYLQNEDDEVFDKLSQIFRNNAELDWQLIEPVQPVDHEDHFEAVAAFGKIFKIKKKNRKTIWKLAKILLPTIGTIIGNSFAVYLNHEPMECINVNKTENTIIIVSEDQREEFECDKIDEAIKKVNEICDE